MTALMLHYGRGVCASDFLLHMDFLEECQKQRRNRERGVPKFLIEDQEEKIDRAFIRMEQHIKFCPVCEELFK